MTPNLRPIPLNRRLPPASVFELAALHAATARAQPEQPERAAAAVHRQPNHTPNRTAVIRRTLREGGDYTAAELAEISGVRLAKYVQALLKTDLMAGQVVKVGSGPKLLYRWNGTPPELAVSVSRQEAAARLLRSCGWKVSAPSQRDALQGGAA
jgi:hypothetical protein